MGTVDGDFLRRVARIPHHGLGLSVEVYAPDLFELLGALDAAGNGRRGLEAGYLEIFKATSPVLTMVRRRLPSARLSYHAEGLWVTQPALEETYSVAVELETAAAHLRTLGSAWMTHECATKQMAGYAFGTYVPPLFTRASAEVTAANITMVQHRLDRLAEASDGTGPLFLLETPPLTYFGFGDLPVAEFFRLVTEATACGVVLDLGHVWTVYRYAGAYRRQSLGAFLAEFLDACPVERIVQIHVAGLAAHGGGSGNGQAESGRTCAAQEADRASSGPPWWIDAHGAPIPEILFDMLEQVLAQPRLTHLKGIALEVDTKPVAQIVREYERLLARFADRFSERAEPGERLPAPPRQAGRSEAGQETLLRQYEAYARTVAGTPGRPPADRAADLPAGYLEPGALEAYRGRYLPDEIMHWGGDLRAMFADTCRRLDAAGVPLDAFVAYWVREPRAANNPYDFFLLKIERFLEFVEEVVPEAALVAGREAAELRAGYAAANEAVNRDA